MAAFVPAEMARGIMLEIMVMICSFKPRLAAVGVGRHEMLENALAYVRAGGVEGATIAVFIIGLRRHG